MNKIGILNTEGMYANPLTGNSYSNKYRNLAKTLSSLPVFQQAQEIISAIKNNQVVLLSAGTGSGKTVWVPKFALHALDYKGKVVVTIPKKGATRSAADFASQHLDVEVGNEVGFQFRGAELKNGRKPKSEKTKLLYSTDGSVVAQLINDPALKEYDIVIVDEAHKRSVQIDLLLLLMKKALKLNPKLKLIIMSATISAQLFADYFQKEFKYAQIELSGATNFPVKINYLQREMKDPKKEFIEKGISTIIRIMEKSENGDILFFVNDIKEANRSCILLNQEIKKKGLEKVFCIELAGGVTPEQEDFATSNTLYKNRNNGPFNRKVVISTNVAEEAITIKNLVYVVDSGWEYRDSYNPDKMERQLLQERISQAQAKQRTGRAGRNRPGECYRLFTEQEYKKFREYPITDMGKSDLTFDLLRFMKLPYVKNIGDLLIILKELIEPPKTEYVKGGLYRLFALGMITNMNKDGVLTSDGETISKFRKLDPSLAKMIMTGTKFDVVYETIVIASLLTKADGRVSNFLMEPRFKNKDPRAKQEQQRFRKVKSRYQSPYGDVIGLLKIYNDYSRHDEQYNEEEIRNWCKTNFLKYNTLKETKKTIKKFTLEVRDILKTDIKKNSNTAINEGNVLFCILEGLYINMAKNIGKNRYKNCFPFEKSVASPAQDTLLSKEATFMVYWEFANIFERTKFNLVCKMPETIVNRLTERQRMFIKTCFIKNRNNRNNKKSYKRKSYKHSTFKKRKFRKFK